MISKRILLIAFIVLPLATLAFGQEKGTSGLTIRSTPPGARIMLSGDVIVSGLTPARFTHHLDGDYKLVLTMHGFEKYTTHLSLDPTREMELSVRMSPKTRFKATARSLFIPGWGQRYNDQKFKGAVFTLLAVGTALNYLRANDDYNDKNRDFRDKVAEYDLTAVNGSIDDLKRLKPLLDKAQREAYDAESYRRLSIGSVIAVWGLNVLDALFLSPGERSSFKIKGLSLKPEASGQSILLSIGKEF